MYTISIDLPDLPKGAEVIIDGLGTFENGSNYDISDEEAYNFQVKHASIRTELDAEGRQQNELVLGRTLSEAFAGNLNIKVKTAKASKAAVVENSEGSEN